MNNENQLNEFTVEHEVDLADAVTDLDHESEEDVDVEANEETPATAILPLYYEGLAPLDRSEHANFKFKPMASAKFLIDQHAVPLTIDEFAQAQRNFPIVFSTGERPVPLALMGLNEGVNTFVDSKGMFNEAVYLPAYARRYPFMLAKLNAKDESTALCFDPNAGCIGEFDDGDPLFKANGDLADVSEKVLQFCEQFESAGQRTHTFVAELKKHNLLMDGEAAISRTDDPDEPAVYRGFQMVDVEKLRKVAEDILRDWIEDGTLSLVYSHLNSLELMRVIASRQVEQGFGLGPQ